MEEIKTEQIPAQNIWSFQYAKGPAHLTGNVRASSKEIAERVAQLWCSSHNVRFLGAQVRPLILADESILIGAERDVEPIDAVGATTRPTLTERVANAFK